MFESYLGAALRRLRVDARQQGATALAFVVLVAGSLLVQLEARMRVEPVSDLKIRGQMHLPRIEPPSEPWPPVVQPPSPRGCGPFD